MLGKISPIDASSSSSSASLQMTRITSKSLLHTSFLLSKVSPFVHELYHGNVNKYMVGSLSEGADREPKFCFETASEYVTWLLEVGVLRSISKSADLTAISFQSTASAPTQLYYSYWEPFEVREGSAFAFHKPLLRCVRSCCTAPSPLQVKVRDSSPGMENIQETLKLGRQVYHPMTAHCGSQAVAALAKAYSRASKLRRSACLRSASPDCNQVRRMAFLGFEDIDSGVHFKKLWESLKFVSELLSLYFYFITICFSPCRADFVRAEAWLVGVIGSAHEQSSREEPGVGNNGEGQHLQPILRCTFYL
jgi:hypothetical protein